MRAGTLALTGGAIILYWGGFLPAWYAFILPLPILLLAGMLRPGLRPVVLVCAGVLSGLAWMAANIAQHQPAITKPSTDIALIGYPCSLIEYSPQGAQRMTLCITQWSDADFPAPARIRLTVPESVTANPLQGPMRVNVNLRPAVAALNAGGGSYERWLYRHGIDGHGRAVFITPDSEQACSLRCRYHRLRQRLRDRLLDHLPRLRQPALVEALTLGSRTGMTEAHWNTLAATGTNHLVAISGLHVGLIAALVGWPISRLLRPLGQRNANLARWLPLAVVALVCGAYALLAGFTVPTRRALIMVLVAGFVLTSGRQWRLWDAWLIALVLVLLLDPVAPLDMGFWLSFGAVACLIFCFGGRYRQPGAARGLLMAQVGVVAGLWPLLSALGRETSLMALAANLFAIPALSLILMPLLLVATPLVFLSARTASWVEPGLDLAFTVFWWVLSRLGELGLMMPQLPLSIVILTALGIFLLVMPVGNLYRSLAMVTLPAVVITQASAHVPADYPSQLRVADGLDGIVLVRARDQVLIFDVRPPSPNGRDRVRERVIPWLEALGVKRIDQLVISHPGVHPEHTWSVIETTIEVGEVFSDHASEWAGQPTVACETGASRDVGDLHAEFWRDPRVPDLPTRESACNLRLVTGNAEALVFGPIGRSGERRLLQWLDHPAEVDLVVMPRQGRAGSSQQGMIELLQPDWAIAAAPAHGESAPDPAVLTLYEEQGAQVRVTGRAGEVVVNLEDELTLTTARENAPFWLRSPSWFEP